MSRERCIAAEEAGCELFGEGDVFLLCSQAQEEGEKPLGTKDSFHRLRSFILCWLFFLNILCFLTINHSWRKKAFKRRGHGVCLPSLAGKAGHQLTAVINLQLSDQSIFICQRRDGRRRTLAVPACRPLPAPAVPRGSPAPDPISSPPAPPEQAPTVPSHSSACLAVTR